MHTRVAVVALAALCLAASAQAQVAPETTHASLGLNFWSPQPDISVAGLDFTGSLGIEKKRLKDVRLTLGTRHKIRLDRKSTRLNSSHVSESRMPSSA